MHQGADVLPLKVESLGTYISIANRTVVSIRLGNGLINVFDTTSIYEIREMNQGAVQAKPNLDYFQKHYKWGVASEWSEPVKWLGEGTPGKDGIPGEDGKDGKDGKDGTSVNIKGTKEFTRRFIPLRECPWRCLYH